MITSTANAQVQELVRLLKQRRARDEAGVFRIGGRRHAVGVKAGVEEQGEDETD